MPPVPGFEFAVLEHLDLVLHRIELGRQKRQQLGAALVLRQQLVQRQLARIQLGHQGSSSCSAAS
jgi:hypothetical protein